MQAGFGVICAGYDGYVALPSSDTWGCIMLIGFAGLLTHFCLTKALSVAPAVTVMPMDFTRLPIIAAIGAISYAEAMNVWIILGAVVIFSANYYNILDERRAKAPEPVLATTPGPLPAGRPKTD